MSDQDDWQMTTEPVDVVAFLRQWQPYRDLEQTNTRLRELVSHYVTRRDLAEIDAALAALADTEQEGA